MVATRQRLAPLPDMAGPTTGDYRTKRLFDLVVTALMALPGVVVGLGCALAVATTSRGPVLFRQERIGRDGVPFQLLKFRTMLDGDNPVFPDASHITTVGTVLRKLSLDELPQLINVIRGEMSIVGPRPTLAYQVERYSARQRRRLEVSPGITGLAQVEGRNSLAWGDRIELDLDYIATRSWRVDLALVLRSVSSVWGGDDTDGHPIDDPLARIYGPGQDRIR